MNKEQILRAFLEDELFTEQGLLKEGEAEKFKWTDPRKIKLIEVLRLSIDGVMSSETEGVSSMKINKYLNG